MAALQLKQRVEALKLLERALLTCQRLDDEREKLKALTNSLKKEDEEGEHVKNKEGGVNASAISAQASNIISPISKYEHGLMALATEGCVLVWNIAKPLLRSSLRKHAHRAMGLASTYLANNHSPLQSLRASLHLELAKCEISTDFLAKVSYTNIYILFLTDFVLKLYIEFLFFIFDVVLCFLILFEGC